MKCKTCGFAASNSSVTLCPFCKEQGTAGFSMAPGGVAPAYSAQSGAAVWPPAPMVALAYPLPGHPDMAAMQKQRQVGILMALIPLAAVQGTSFFSNLPPAPYGSLVMAIVVLAGIYPHFRGCAHWAESKGYPRYEGRLLGILGWLGVLFLAIRRDKTRTAA